MIYMLINKIKSVCIGGIDELLSPNSHLFKPFNIYKLLSCELMDVHSLIQISKLILILNFLLFSTFNALVIQENKLRRICVLNWQPLNFILLLSQSLRALIIMNHSQLVHSIYKYNHRPLFCECVHVSIFKNKLIFFEKFFGDAGLIGH